MQEFTKNGNMFTQYNKCVGSKKFKTRRILREHGEIKNLMVLRRFSKLIPLIPREIFKVMSQAKKGGTTRL